MYFMSILCILLSCVTLRLYYFILFHIRKKRHSGNNEVEGSAEILTYFLGLRFIPSVLYSRFIYIFIKA